MDTRILIRAAILAALIAVPQAKAAETAPTSRATPQFTHEIPNIPGKKLVSAIVDYPPGGKSAPHHHAKSAFIYVYVLSGAIRSQVDDAEPKIYHVGESFFETPGAHHRVSENASATEPAKMMAVFVVDASETALTTPD